MKKMIGNIKRALYNARRLLAGLLAPQPTLRPVPVRIKRTRRNR